MALGAGYKSIMGAGKETTYRTALAVDELVPLVSEGFSKVFERIEQDYIHGKAGKSVDDQAPAQVVGAAVSVPIVYDTIAGAVFGTDLLISAAMGAGAFVSTRSQFTLAEELTIPITIAFEKDVSVHEAVSCYADSMELSASAGGHLVGNFTYNAHNFLQTGDAGIVNVVGDLTGLVPTAQPERVLFSDLTIRIADDANALAAGDQIKISEFTLTLNNALTDPDFASPANSGHTDSGLSDEYVRNGFREVTFSITLPRYDADTFLTFLKNDEKLAADLKFSDGTNEINIFIPTLKVTEWNGNVDSPGLVPVTVNFTCFRKHPDNTAADEFTSTNKITEEFGIETLNLRSGHALA